jgi:hypothetical protein
MVVQGHQEAQVRRVVQVAVVRQEPQGLMEHLVLQEAQVRRVVQVAVVHQELQV